MKISKVHLTLSIKLLTDSCSFFHHDLRLYHSHLKRFTTEFSFLRRGSSPNRGPRERPGTVDLHMLCTALGNVYTQYKFNNLSIIIDNLVKMLISFTWTCPVKRPEWLITKEILSKSNICLVSLKSNCKQEWLICFLLTFLDWQGPLS